ncbi:MAG TPA: TA system VapC family ribonuclease toxin [Chthoniobacterales bacterium]
MSYSLDANLLLYASDTSSPHFSSAKTFLEAIPRDPDLLCLTWITLLSYQRIATHPAIFRSPLAPAEAWANVTALLTLPRVRLIGEDVSFAEDYAATAAAFPIRGNLVLDAHLATILREHGVRRLYTADADFRKFEFLDVVNPLKA